MAREKGHLELRFVSGSFWQACLEMRPAVETGRAANPPTAAAQSVGHPLEPEPWVRALRRAGQGRSEIRDWLSAIGLPLTDNDNLPAWGALRTQ